MKLPYFVVYILILTAGWIQFYSAAHHVFNGVSEYKSEITLLKERNEKQTVALANEHEQFIEFRQNVSALMPDVLRDNGLGEKGYAYRSLASTITKNDAEKVRKVIAKTLFESAKENFRKKQYEKSNRQFKQIIDRYSFSTYVTESYFLLSEGYYQQNELEQCTEIIKQMVELFPSHELTGFALIRLGRIYQVQNRNEEAVDIYKTVLRSFPQRDVAAQAKSSLKGVEL